MEGIEPSYLGGCTPWRGLNLHIWGGCTVWSRLNPHIWGAEAHGGGWTPMFGRLHGMEKLNPHIWGATAYRGDFTPIFGGLRPMGAVSPYKEHFALRGGFCSPTCGDFPPCLGGLWSSKGGFHPPGRGFTPVCGAVGDFTPHMGALHLVGGFTPYVWGFPSVSPSRGAPLSLRGGLSPHIRGAAHTVPQTSGSPSPEIPTTPRAARISGSPSPPPSSRC